MRLAALKREEDGLQREKERLETEKERHFRSVPFSKHLKLARPCTRRSSLPLVRLRSLRPQPDGSHPLLHVASMANHIVRLAKGRCVRLDMCTTALRLIVHREGASPEWHEMA